MKKILSLFLVMLMAVPMFGISSVSAATEAVVNEIFNTVTTGTIVAETDSENNLVYEGWERSGSWNSKGLIVNASGTPVASEGNLLALNNNGAADTLGNSYLTKNFTGVSADNVTVETRIYTHSNLSLSDFSISVNDGADTIAKLCIPKIMYVQYNDSEGLPVSINTTKLAGQKWYAFKFSISKSVMGAESKYTSCTYELLDENNISAGSATVSLPNENQFSLVDNVKFSFENSTRGGVWYMDYLKVNATSAQALPKVSKPVWNGTKLTWDSVENADSYAIDLYKNDSFVKTVSVTDGLEKELSDLFLLFGDGSYTAKIKAIGNGSTYSDGELSDLSDSYVFDSNHMKVINNIFDFEDDRFELGQIVELPQETAQAATDSSWGWTSNFSNTVSVVAQKDNEIHFNTGNVLKIDAGETPTSGQIIPPTITAISDSVLSFKSNIYISNPDTDIISFTVDGTSGTNSVLSFVINQGELQYYNSINSKHESFCKEGTSESEKALVKQGWNTIEIFAYKTEDSLTYNKARYILNDEEKFVAADATGIRNNKQQSVSAFKFGVTSPNTIVYLDNITFSTFGTETRTQAVMPVNAQWQGHIFQWTPASDDNASAYTVRLYKDDLLYATKTILPSQENNVDFTEDLFNGGTGVYAATVQAKNNYQTYIPSAETDKLEFVNAGISYGDCEIAFPTVTDNQNGTLTITSTVKRISLSDTVKPYVLIAASYGDMQLTDSAYFKLDTATSQLSTVGGSVNVSLTVTKGETLKIFHWESLDSLKPILSEDILY